MIFNFVDKITAFIHQKAAIGEKTLTQAQLPYSKEGQLLPMLLVEAIGQLNAWITMEMNNFQVRPVAILYDEINIYATAKIGDKVVIETELTRFDETTSLFNGRVKLADKVLVEVINAAGSFLNINEFASAEEYQTQLATLTANISHCKSSEAISRIYRLDIFDFDQIHYTDHKVIASKCINPNYPFFTQHFPKKPVLPVSILLQNNIDLGKELIRQQANSMIEFSKIQLGKIKMRDFIYPNSLLLTQIELVAGSDNSFCCNFINTVNDNRVCRGAITYLN